ncbi:type IX secretion system membrane protein PorP/SprF [Pedobacter sp. SYSU D00535]|uniref:PorP/SprF family type IX secretion system membrane protein n=1 Tax=Pedobacter sp. SYSU D00535 TaxID=2810308 RepID=UPI001A95F030|nr:type IX secretion system membrane protein PorP/SprF [Pedobacter sp. SYSU D00535]
MKRYLPTVFLLFLSTFVVGQQDAQYSQYMFNTMVVNPAYAGYRETINASLLHRDQWTGLQGAPKTQSLVLDGAFGRDNKVGLGLAVVNDKIGLQRQSSVYVNYAYRLPVGEEGARLSFGLAAGIGQYVLNASDATFADPNDPNLAANQTHFVPDGRFGIYYSDNRFYAGVSAVNLMSKAMNYQEIERDSEIGRGNTVVRQGRHFFLTAGYLVNLNEDFKFKPSFLIKEDTKGPTNLDVNSFFLVKESFWIGASYRTGVNLWKKSSLNSGTFHQNSVVGVVETYFSNKFRVGYAYDYSLSDLGNYSNGTHEISLGVVLNGNKKSTALLTPRYF